MLLIDSKHNGNVLLIYRKLAELEDDAECAPLSKITKLVKKLSNLTRTGKEKYHCPIFYLLTCFVEPIRRLCFCFAESLADLTDGLVMGGAKLKGKDIAVGFFG